MDTNFKGERLGWGPWRRDWYSICSKHIESSRDCKLCMRGYYSWFIPHTIGHFFHDYCYWVWYWWVNRPRTPFSRIFTWIFPNKKDRWLLSVFPNLGRKTDEQRDIQETHKEEA